MDSEINKWPVSITRNRPYVSNVVFRKHIASILKKSTKFDITNIERWTSDKFANDWETSRTHPTYDIDNSYERVEFFGDKLANSIVSLYVSETYPEIVNTEWLTKIQNYMHSRTGFMQISYLIGFYKYVLISDDGWNCVTGIPAKYATRKDSSVWMNPDWKKMLTDLFEAFIGTLFNVVRKDQKSFGVAYEVISTVGNHFFAKISISKNIYFLVDPVTLLKESMDEKRHKLGLGIKDTDTRYAFLQHFIREDRIVKLETGESTNEYRFLLTLPRTGIDRENYFVLKNRYTIIAVNGAWFPDVTEARKDTAQKGLEVWKYLGYKVKEKPHYSKRAIWKETSKQ